MSTLGDAGQIGTATAGFVAGSGFAWAVARWLWRRFVNAVLEAVHRVERKVTPNGGSDPESLGTRVAVLEGQIRTMTSTLSAVATRLGVDAETV